MVVLTWGSGVAATYSRVMRLITLSSTESEHVAVKDGCQLGIHADHMATEMGLKSNGKIIIYQDNTLAIWLTANEGNLVKNRHVKIRRNYVKEQVIKGKLLVLYQRSEDMVAHIGTKPVTSIILNRHINTLNMVKLKIQVD